MTEQDNLPSSSDEVKVVFDVMPAVSETAPLVRQVPKLPNLPPAAEKPVSPPPVATPPPAASPSGEHRRSWLPITVFGLLLLIILAGGYGAYWYFSQRQQTQTPPPPEKQPVVKPALPKEWLQRYFHVETCQDQSLCGPEADPDRDGLTNAEELKYNTNPLVADTDFDGLSDGDEIKIYSTDPVVADTDGDGVEDGLEVRTGRNPAISTPTPTPASPLEKQQWQEAIAKYGQHEPTQTFLSFVEFYTIFKPTTTPQLIMSVPADWKFDSVNYTDTVKTVKGPDAGSRVVLRSGVLFAATTTEQAVGKIRASLKALAGYQPIRSAQQTIVGRLEYSEEYQYRVADGTTLHALTYTIPKGNFVHTVTVEAKEPQWAGLAFKAVVMLQSVR